MKNETNIYDIDGNIIRKAGDNHRFTIEEMEKMVDDLTKKVHENPENEVYKVYLDNAHKWLMYMYNNMSKEELVKRITAFEELQKEAVEKQNEAKQRELDAINDAIDQLKTDYESEIAEDVENIRPRTVMDEYVEPIEEIND